MLSWAHHFEVVGGAGKGDYSEDIGTLGCRGAPQAPTCSHRLGGGLIRDLIRLRMAASPGFLRSGPADPPPTDPDTTDSQGVSPTSHVTGVGSYTECTKGRKMNGYAQQLKASNTIGQKKMKALFSYPWT